MITQELKERFIDYRSKKEKLKSVKRNYDMHEKTLKTEEQLLIDEIAHMNLNAIEIPEVGTFSVTNKVNFFFPKKGERQEFLQMVERKMGQAFLEEKLTMSYGTVTSLQKAFVEDGVLKPDEGLPNSKSTLTCKLSVK